MNARLFMARRRKPSHPLLEEFRDFAEPATRVTVGEIIGGFACLVLLFALIGYTLASFAAADALMRDMPHDWRPVCLPHECEQLMREPPVTIWEGVDL